MNRLINAGVVDEAIFKILRRERVRVGGWIRLSTISRNWLLTGLRRADLAEGLARLDTRGYLYLEAGNADSFAILRKSPPLFRRNMLTAWLLLKRTKSRPRNGSSTADRRRSMASIAGERAANC